jgi:exopolysaccharide biosynthesis operon protein EpsL
MSSFATQLRSCCALVIAASACGLPDSAYADADDLLKLILTETLTHDDNVYRTSSAAAPPIVDTITSTTVGLTLDTNLSRQHLRIALSQSESRYKRLAALNNSGSNYQWAWQGTFPGKLTTDASWSRSVSLASFADQTSTLAKDVVTTESSSFRLGYLIHPDLPIYVQVANGSSSNSVATLATNDARTTSTEVGVQYNSPLGNQAGLLLRKTVGRYPNRQVVAGLVDNSYRQDDAQATVQWKPGFKSTIDFRVGQTQRIEDDLPQHNFTGATGSLSFDWALTDMISINAKAGRELTALDFSLTNSVNYAVVQSHGVGVRWAPTSKISAVARIDEHARVLGGGVGNVVVMTDTTRVSSLALQYAPMRAVQLSVQLNHEVRESNNSLTLPYVSNTGLLGATLSF